MTLTSAACPLTDEIEDQTRVALSEVVKDFRINWVWMPPWGRTRSPTRVGRCCGRWGSTSELRARCCWSILHRVRRTRRYVGTLGSASTSVGSGHLLAL